VAAWLTFCAEDLEWVENPHDTSPRARHRMRGYAQIGTFLAGIAAADIDLAVADEVIGPDCAVSAITALLPGGMSMSTSSCTYDAVASRARSTSRPGPERASNGARRDPPTPVLNEPSSRQRITAIPFPGPAPAVCELTLAHRHV
jgi:hypothetical protein